MGRRSASCWWIRRPRGESPPHPSSHPFSHFLSSLPRRCWLYLVPLYVTKGLVNVLKRTFCYGDPWWKAAYIIFLSKVMQKWQRVFASLTALWILEAWCMYRISLRGSGGVAALPRNIQVVISPTLQTLDHFKKKSFDQNLKKTPKYVISPKTISSSHLPEM